VELIFVSNDKDKYALKSGGKLSDLAPSVLSLLGLEIPKDMTSDVIIVRK
jgi:2,3-bisphosphoglycerate-independent phosphoglycerate mutase